MSGVSQRRSGATAAGLTTGGFLRMAGAGMINPGATARSAIFIELPGGPSHIDTFDLKPDAPAEFRGEFSPIATNVPGMQICEHLPKLAGQADKFAILRGVSHSLGAHPLGQKFVFSGNRPTPSVEYPGFGSIAARELGAGGDLPAYVAIPKASRGPGYLGVQYAPLATNAIPRADRPFNVRGISLAGGLEIQEIERRRGLLNDLDQRFREIQESDTIRGMYGDDPFSQSCLLAGRLVESGVRFVTVSLGGWDTHNENFTKLKETLLPRLDAGVSGLLAALDAKGLLETTAVYATGEFGRTPKIQERAGAGGGRNHYPRCMCMLMAGGGIRGGQVIGESDATAAGPADRLINPEDTAATFLHTLGSITLKNTTRALDARSRSSATARC